MGVSIAGDCRKVSRKFQVVERLPITRRLLVNVVATDRVICERMKHMSGRKGRVLDPVTVLAILGGGVHLINELLTLKQKLRQQKSPPKVTIQNLRGDSVKLTDTSEEQLRNLVETDSRDKDK